MVVRVVRIFSSSALQLGDHGCGSEVSSRKTSSSDELSATSSWSGTPAAKARSPTRSLVVPCASSACSLLRVVSICSRRSASASFASCGRADANRAADAGGQLLERGLDDELAAVDDQHLIDGLRNLGQHVAGDQHSPALPARRRAGSRAASAHPPGRARSRARRGSAARDRRAARLQARAAGASRASTP